MASRSFWRSLTMPTREQRRWKHWTADKEMRLVRKDIKHNRKPKGDNRKSVAPARPDAWEETETPEVERIMPRGERERRRTVVASALAKLEADGTGSSAEPAVGPRGIVVEVSSSLCRVDVAGRELMCSLRGSLSARDTGFTNVIAVGDHVVVSDDGAGRGVVEAVLPRQSVLARPDVFRSHLQQVVVANADQLLIVASWREPPIWLELIDRYL